MKHCPEPTESHDDKLYTYYYEKQAVEDDRHAEIEAERRGDADREERGVNSLYGIKTGTYRGRRVAHVVDFTLGGRICVCFGRYSKYSVRDVTPEYFWEWCAKYKAKRETTTEKDTPCASGTQS
jgi:hypothetical protein